MRLLLVTIALALLSDYASAIDSLDEVEIRKYAQRCLNDHDNLLRSLQAEIKRLTERQRKNRTSRRFISVDGGLGYIGNPGQKERYQKEIQEKIVELKAGEKNFLIRFLLGI